MKARILAALLLLLLVPLDASAANFGFWVVNALKTIHTHPPRGGGKFLAVVLNGTSRLPAAELTGERLRVVKEIDAGALSSGGIYELLADAFRDEAFDCVIVGDLKPHQIVGVEHFARVHRVLPVSTDPDVGVVPFAIDALNNVVYWRLSALKRYGLVLARYAPRLELLSLDPLACAATAKQRQWAPERVCYVNAGERRTSGERAMWDAAIADLSVAIVIAPDEGVDHRAFDDRAWGRERYHPHYAMATFLGRFGSCEMAERELALSIVPDPEKRQVRLDCASRRSAVRLEDPLGDLAAAVHQESQPLPPFRPDVPWDGWLSFD